MPEEAPKRISKNVSDYTDAELIEIGIKDPIFAAKIRSVYKQGILMMEAEMRRHETMLADFTTRLTLLFTVAGLLALLPALAEPKDYYLQSFLTWTFPFLIAAIIFFYFSTKRMSALLTNIPVIAEGEPEELVLLKMQSGALNNIWKSSLDVYNRALAFYRPAATCVYLYMISFAINFYLYSFNRVPLLPDSFLIFFALFTLGFVMTFWQKSFNLSFTYTADNGQNAEKTTD